MPFVAGNDIHAHCSDCARDTKHTVIEVHAGVVQVVRCPECKGQHPYKKPRRPKPATRKKAARPRKRAPAKKKVKEVGPPMEWQEQVLGCDPETARPYSFKETFAAGDIINHKKFGLGVVTGVEDTKISVAFRDSRKKLVHGRS